MSAARDYKYLYETIEPQKAPRVKLRTKQKKIAQPWYARLMTIILIFGFLLTAATLPMLILQRKARIDALQLEAFNTKREIVDIEKKIDSLLVEKESFMTIYEIEKYASENLNMITATERHKVIIESDQYMTLDKSIAFEPVLYQVQEQRASGFIEGFLAMVFGKNVALE